MPLDHYVSQVHLKNFYSPKLGRMMYAIHKNNFKKHPTNAAAVCRTENGSTNLYLEDVRLVERFLESIEPKYNTAINKLVNDQIDVECIYVIAGFVAYILTCSPTGMRIKSEYLKALVEETTKVADKQGLFPALPSVLASESLTQLMKNGEITIDIDPKYPQAIGIGYILHFIKTFGNSDWEILINPYDENAFFTSDFPVAIEETGNVQIKNRIIPLSPNLAIRIKSFRSLATEQNDFLFRNFRYLIKHMSRKQVNYINRLIVRCADNMIFYRDDYDWITRFVEKNALFRIETKIHKIPQGKGVVILTSEEVIRIK